MSKRNTESALLFLAVPSCRHGQTHPASQSWQGPARGMRSGQGGSASRAVPWTCWAHPSSVPRGTQHCLPILQCGLPGHWRLGTPGQTQPAEKKQGWVMRILSHFTHWKIRLKFVNWKYPVSNAGSNADTPAVLSFVPAHFLSVT